MQQVPQLLQVQVLDLVPVKLQPGQLSEAPELHLGHARAHADVHRAQVLELRLELARYVKLAAALHRDFFHVLVLLDVHDIPYVIRCLHQAVYFKALHWFFVATLSKFHVL